MNYFYSYLKLKIFNFIFYNHELFLKEIIINCFYLLNIAMNYYYIYEIKNISLLLEKNN